MNRNELRVLQSISAYPSISILMPTHRSYPQNQQDKIRLKNLINSSASRLNSEFSKKDISPVIEKLEKIQNELDFSRMLDGLAIFVNNNTSLKYLFQFPVKERVLIDNTFATRDLVFAYNRSQPYCVIVLNEKLTKIYEGVRENINEIKHPKLPVINIAHEIKDRKIEEGTVSDRIRINEERQKNYFREVDLVFKEILSGEETPFIITGTDRQISMYREITRFGSQLIGSLRGSYETLSLANLAKIAWPEAKKGFAERRHEVIKQLDKAISAKKFASGIDEVWKLAAEGRGLILIVEINYAYPATLDRSQTQLIPAEIKPGAEIMDDAVDELIEKVINTGGKVMFVDNGTLEKYGRIAMILRY